jgi:hypothetical protein
VEVYLDGNKIKNSQTVKQSFFFRLKRRGVSGQAQKRVVLGESEET